MAAQDKALPVAVRAWLTEQGTPAGSRGRLSTAQYSEFLAAHPRKRSEIAKAQGVTLPKSGTKAYAEALTGLAMNLTGAGKRTVASA